MNQKGNVLIILAVEVFAFFVGVLFYFKTHSKSTPQSIIVSPPSRERAEESSSPIAFASTMPVSPEELTEIKEHVTQYFESQKSDSVAHNMRISDYSII